MPTAKHRSAIVHLKASLSGVERAQLRLQQAMLALGKKDEDNRHNIQNCKSALEVWVTTTQTTIVVLESEPEQVNKDG